jgi:hypothetical protein
MRTTILIMLAALAACSDSAGENKAEPVAAASIEGGFWEVTHEVTSMKPTDNAPTPAVKVTAGDKATSNVCVGEADRNQPAPALFAGEGYECEYRNSYIKSGRINASLSCKREGVSGEIVMSVEGSYTGTTLDATVNSTSYLPGTGDFEMATKVTGRHVGACPPEPAEGATPKA